VKPEPVGLLLDSDQLLEVCGIGCRRRIHAIELGRSEPLGSPTAEPWGNDIESAGGEKVVSLYTGERWRKEIVRNLVPPPPDVGDHIEVRWTRHQDGYLPVYLRDQEKEDRIFFLVTGSLPLLKIVGWRPAVEAMAGAYWKKMPRGEFGWCVDQGNLYDPRLYAKWVPRVLA
jgi:hypothetical protein